MVTAKRQQAQRDAQGDTAVLYIDGVAYEVDPWTLAQCEAMAYSEGTTLDAVVGAKLLEFLDDIEAMAKLLEDMRIEEACATH